MKVVIVGGVAGGAVPRRACGGWTKKQKRNAGEGPMSPSRIAGFLLLSRTIDEREKLLVTTRRN